MKNKVNETNVYVNKVMYKDPDIQQTSKKYKENLVVLPDDKYNQMLKNQNANSTSDSMYSDSSTSSSVTTSTLEETDVDAVIEPQDQATIKYLSNVKDHKTGEVSKPFVIADKKYQMVRGIKPNREVVLGVLCFEDMDEMGNHKIHDVDHFEKTIAIPMKECGMGQMNPMQEKKEPSIDFLNLSDLDGYKHFFVNKKTGEIIAKFKTTKDIIKSGIKLGPDEDYMDARTLKRFRFDDFLKPEMNEEEVAQEDPNKVVGGVNTDKLQSDVRKLARLIKNKFSVALSKIDKPIEQVQFIKAIASEVGIPLNKLASLISSFKDIAQTDPNLTTPEPTADLKTTNETKIINKDSLLESLGVKQTITKIKDNNNGK